MTPATAPDTELRHAEHDTEVAACFALMRQLRPHLASADQLVARWRRQAATGYRLLVLWDRGRPVALAGWRVQENLVRGVHAYVDDLVTDADARSSGYGQQVMDRLKHEARQAGCRTLVLDTPLANVLGHRFYYRNGLLASALHFHFPLAGNQR
ncbi:putative acetyltransferase (plasmid) [Cupriavidus taiwanensis]|uniref:Putative acetyltransferase n=1 Tax=Cupriavidus taiwanensis TaxID=164546 RepID=A0A375IIN3_9BURK|nr:GNAT family N-acetyltransferase [Cupriavidus taiwanensis]SPK74427.1 putative acetyltransferase [Cupriavidus taiwanensis]